MYNKQLIFDGDCGICTKLSQYAEKKFKADIEVYPYQFKSNDELPFDIEHKLAAITVIFVKEDRYFVRSRAVFEAMKYMPGIWTIPAYLFANKIFAFLFDPIYKIIAKNRGKISRMFGLDACKIDFAATQD
jgi:predicted DCC family thiol-disulfide oxidoreductase YuxK